MNTRERASTTLFTLEGRRACGATVFPVSRRESRGKWGVRFLAALAALFVLPAFAAQAASFDLPAQPLADAIRAVGSQTNTNVLFDPPLVADRSARPLKGDLSAEQALTKILAGTGIKYEFLNDTTIVLASANATLRARGEGPGGEGRSCSQPSP